MSNYLVAYSIGKSLALAKIAQEIREHKINDVEELTSVLENTLDPNKVQRATKSENVLDSSERASGTSWGDKIDLETSKNTGLNV